MNNRLYTFFAAIVMVVLLAPVTETRAQRQVQVMELQKQPDGTEIYVQKTIEVPEKPASVIAAEKARAASVTADEDDLQYYLNHIVKTRAGESAVVIDLSTFSATTRETTLEVNQGISIKFTNGTLKRGTGLAKGSPIIRISNGTEVEFDETVTISGENLTTNGPAVELQDASLKTAAWIGNTRYGTQGVVVTTIFASSSSSKLEVTGGTISSGGVAYYGTQPLIVSGGDIGWTRIYSEADAIISGENTIIPISFENKTSKLYLKSAVKNLQFYDYYNVISDGYAVATGYDGYQLTESDLQMINVTNYDESVNDLKDYEKRLEGNSIVMRKIVNELVDIVEDYPVYEEKFNLCDAISFSSTTWAQFDNYILDRLNLTMEQFNAQYEADIDETTIVDQSDGNKVARANVYSDTNGIKATYTCPATNNKVPFGSVLYYYDDIHRTLDRFQWTLTEDELEYLTHDKETLPVNLKQYIRYIGQNGAKYKYIYVKLEANIGRDAVPATGIKEKINNYWFGLDGNTDGWDAVALCVNYPNSTSGTPTTWSNTLLSTFKVNKLEFTDNKLNGLTGVNLWDDIRKFFFAPINTTITDFHGNTWTITAKSSASDEKWNAFVCHNDICCAENHEDIAKTAVDHATNSVTNPEYRAYDANCTANLHGSQKYTTHKFQVTADGKSDDAKNSAILQKCAIDYREGCFENVVLYATKDGENFTPIVELDKATGELSLIRPAVANPQDASRNDYVPFSELDMVLNAIGYKGDIYENISEQLHTWVGVVVNNGCGVARDLFTVHGNNNDNYSIFETSWRRPINLVTTDPAPIEDANHNGELICVYDHLAFYDWRGPVEGDMEGVNKWLWGYYNIHQIKFDLDPAKVMTNMYQASETTFVPLSSVSKDVHLYAYESWNYITGTGIPCSNPLLFSSTFDIRNFANQSLNANLLAYLNLNKGKFGYIFYENNGENVNTFTVKVPVEICHEWGHLDTYVTITILSTQGGLQSDINNAADNTETTIDLDNYGELTTGILIPAGKKIKMTGTKNVTLAANFTGDYIFRTEGDAQLDITVPGFSGYSSTALPKYGFVAGGSASKIIVNQSGTNTLALPNTLLATENGGTIDCYANISTKGIYNAAGGTMNIYSESGEVETFTDEGGTVNITGPVKFYSTFTSLGTATLLSENVTSLAKLVLGKQSSMTFTSKWVKPTSLNISFKDNDYVLDQTYITFEKSTTMLSGFETVRFTLQSEHSAYLDNDTHQLSIEETDHAAQAAMIAEIKAQIQVSYEMAAEIQYRVKALEESIYSYHKSGIPQIRNRPHKMTHSSKR